MKVFGQEGCPECEDQYCNQILKSRRGGGGGGGGRGGRNTSLRGGINCANKMQFVWSSYFMISDLAQYQ